MKFLSSKHAIVLTALLIVQGALFRAIAMRDEVVPPVAPLTAFPKTVGSWYTSQDIKVEQEVQDVLKADDILNREYSLANREKAYLFIAYFKSQRYGQAPHSPKNCLPGSGWEPVEDEIMTIPVAGRPPIQTHRYVVEHGADKDVVIYWYQSHNRVIAGEFSAKFWLVADSIKYHRSDSALVRIVVPVTGSDSGEATNLAVSFIQSMFPSISAQLPN
jgi:EpsI family protein